MHIFDLNIIFFLDLTHLLCSIFANCIQKFVPWPYLWHTVDHLEEKTQKLISILANFENSDKISFLSCKENYVLCLKEENKQKTKRMKINLRPKLKEKSNLRKTKKKKQLKRERKTNSF